MFRTSTSSYEKCTNCQLHLPSKNPHVKDVNLWDPQAIATRAAVGNGWPWMSWAKTNFSWSVRWGLGWLICKSWLVWIDWKSWSFQGMYRKTQLEWLDDPTMLKWKRLFFTWWNKIKIGRLNRLNEIVAPIYTLPSQSFTCLKSHGFQKDSCFSGCRFYIELWGGLLVYTSGKPAWLAGKFKTLIFQSAIISHVILCWNAYRPAQPGSKLVILGMVIPPSIGNPYSRYLNTHLLVGVLTPPPCVL